MGYFKGTLFLAICFVAGIGIARAFLAWNDRGGRGRGFEQHLDQAVQTGVGDAPAYRGFTVTAAQVPAIGELAKTWQGVFATTVGIEYSPALTKEALAEAVKAAHKRKMAVVLLPPPVFALQNPYPRELKEIAAEAQGAKVEILCISWLNGDPDPAYWRQQAAAVRQVFKGKIILAGEADMLAGVGCWDAVDMIGVIGPMAIPRWLPHSSEDVKLHDVRVMWDSELTELESLARVQVKKLALLRMNVPLRVSQKWAEAGSVGDRKLPAANFSLQRMMYEALLLETKGRAEISDVLLFNWGAAGDMDAPNVEGTGVMGKIGELWDPKKGKVAETVPAVEDDGVDTGPDGRG